MVGPGGRSHQSEQASSLAVKSGFGKHSNFKRFYIQVSLSIIDLNLCYMTLKVMFSSFFHLSLQDTKQQKLTVSAYLKMVRVK